MLYDALSSHIALVHISNGKLRAKVSAADRINAILEPGMIIAEYPYLYQRIRLFVVLSCLLHFNIQS